MSGKTNQPHNNPYASAAGTYGSNAQKHAEDPRELEARVLLKAAQFMQDLQDDWEKLTSDDIADILRYNRTIWVMFYDTAMENTGGIYPADLRANIANLSSFVFKRETDVLASPAKEKLDVLISINRNIADGLLKGMRNAPQQDKLNPLSQNADTKIPPMGGTDTSA